MQMRLPGVYCHMCHGSTRGNKESQIKKWQLYIEYRILLLGCGVNGKAVWSMAPGDCEFDPHHPNYSALAMEIREVFDEDWRSMLIDK